MVVVILCAWLASCVAAGSVSVDSFSAAGSGMLRHNATSFVVAVEADNATRLLLLHDHQLTAFSEPFTSPVPAQNALLGQSLLASDRQGGYFVAGVAATSDYTTSMYFVARVNATGGTAWGPLWVNSTNDPEEYPNTPSALLAHPSSPCLIVAGSYQGVMTLDPSVVLPPLMYDSADGFLACLNAATGAPVWATGFGNLEENGLVAAHWAPGASVATMVVSGDFNTTWKFAGSGGDMVVTSTGTSAYMAATVDVATGKAVSTKQLCSCKSPSVVDMPAGTVVGAAAPVHASDAELVSFGLPAPLSIQCECGGITPPPPPPVPHPSGGELSTYNQELEAVVNTTTWSTEFVLPLVSTSPFESSIAFAGVTVDACGQILIAGQFSPGVFSPPSPHPGPYGARVGPAVGLGGAVIPGNVTVTAPTPQDPNRQGTWVAKLSATGSVTFAQAVASNGTAGVAYYGLGWTPGADGCAASVVVPGYYELGATLVDGTKLPTCSNPLYGSLCGALITVGLQ